MKLGSFFLLLLLAVPAFVSGASESAPPATTPVATVRAFFEALALGDEAKVKALCVSNPKLKVLYTPKPTKEEEEELQKAAKGELRVLRPGEVVPMDGGAMTVPPPNNNLVFVHGPGLLFPVPVSRSGNTWKVNAGPFINAKEQAAKKK